MIWQPEPMLADETHADLAARVARMGKYRTDPADREPPQQDAHVAAWQSAGFIQWCIDSEIKRREAHWEDVREYVGSLKSSLAAIRSAASRPNLGYLLSDAWDEEMSADG